MPSSRALLTVGVVLAGVAVGGCADPRARADGEPFRVVAAFYPLEYAAAQVGGSDVRVTGLTKPGSEPHEVELTARQVASIADADLVVVLGGFQPAVDDAVEQQAEDAELDVRELNGDARDDPHVWLDPRRYAEIATAVEERLAAIDPVHVSAYRSRADALRSELGALDDEFRAGLRTCERKELVTSHNAFGYLAGAYGLEQIGITGLTPEEEPAPKRLAEVTDLARRRHVTTIFFEDLVSPKVAESLAREVGARAAVLSPIESPPDRGDYFTAMRANLAALRVALGCS